MIPWKSSESSQICQLPINICFFHHLKACKLFSASICHQQMFCHVLLLLFLACGPSSHQLLPLRIKNHQYICQNASNMSSLSIPSVFQCFSVCFSVCCYFIFCYYPFSCTPLPSCIPFILFFFFFKLCAFVPHLRHILRWVFSAQSNSAPITNALIYANTSITCTSNYAKCQSSFGRRTRWQEFHAKKK